MSTTLRFIAGGATIGLLAAGMLALPTVLPALADEEPAKTLLGSMRDFVSPRFNPDDLARYDFTVEPSVSDVVIETRTVRKIGYGRTEFVEIITTPSGVYSSDGLASPHVRYPGIHKELKRSPMAHMAMWTNGGGWVAFKEVDAGSFMTINAFEGGELIVTEDGNCVAVEQSVRC